MNAISRLRNAWAAWNGNIEPTPLPEITRNSSTWDFMFSGIGGLPSVNEKSVLSISAAYACVNLIAGAISALPFNIYNRSKTGEREQDHGDALWWVLNEQFLPRWNAANAWEFLVMSLLFHGDAFATIIRKGGQIVGMEPLHPLTVTVAATPDRMRLVYAVTRTEGGYDVFDQDDMIHVPGFGFNGFRGVSPIRNVLSISGGVSLAMQEYAGRFFTNSARPDVILTTDKAINKEIAEEMKTRWMETYSGLANVHKPAVLGQGFKVERLTMSAEDAQLLATRQFQLEEIARAYGVPPFMIGHTEKTTSWGSGVETMGTGFVRFTLRQHLNKIQTEINRKCFRTAAKCGEFDTFELERADMRTLFEGFRIALGRAGEPGFMTPDEVRQKLNLSRKPGGDTLATGATNAPQPTN